MNASRFLPAIALLAASGLALTGCGESDADADVDAGQASLSQAEELVQEYAEKLMAGDVSACDLESDKYKEEQQALASTDDCPERIKSLVSAEEPAVDLSDVTYTATVEGGETRVAVIFPDGPEFDGADVLFHLVEDGDSWLVDRTEQL